MTTPPEFETDLPETSSAPDPAPPEPEVSALAVEDIPAEPERAFEDLTLSEAFGAFLQQPGATVRALFAVAQAEDAGKAPAPSRNPFSRLHSDRPQRAKRQMSAVEQRELAILGGRFAAFFLALWGCAVMANAPLRTETLALDAGAPYLLLGFMLWVIIECFVSFPALRRWWDERRAKASLASDESDVDLTSETPVLAEAPPAMAAKGWDGIHPVRAIGALVGLIFSALAFQLTLGNYFSFVGFWSWIISIIIWLVVLAPFSMWSDSWAGLRRVARLDWLRSRDFWILMLILLMGAWFRLVDLPQNPPEMTSDHVEKILDSQRVLNGVHQVFMPNNGGRESLQMYLMAALSQVPGLGMNFTTLKLLSVIEGLISIVAMYWMTKEIIGTQKGPLANTVALLVAALVALSYWHVILSRLGLRIVLTTLITSVLMVYLARAMRHNRRVDYVKAGFVLGIGLYMYQAVRMLPLVVLMGIGLAVIFKARSLRERGHYLLNLGVLVLMAGVIFVPLLGFWMQYPEDFWRRTSGRLLGDAIIQYEDENGNLLQRNATIQERLDGFSENLPTLTNNFRNALLMYNWKGDVAWINAAPNQPTLDVFSGALLIVGLGAWAAQMVRRRDVVDWLIPLSVLVLLLPSALSIAFPIENPSHTRTSGTLPLVYMIAALPLGILVQSLLRMGRQRRWAVMLAGGLVAVVLVGGYARNAHLYFNDYRASYEGSSLPHSEAGRILKGFAESDGSYGNAFVIGYPHWWDARAVGIEGGVEHDEWRNGVEHPEQLLLFLRDASLRSGPHKLDPELDLLFFLSVNDHVMRERLQELFPEGRYVEVQSYQPEDSYGRYRVPALGYDGFNALVGLGPAE
jgi:hypothetical protein